MYFSRFLKKLFVPASFLAIFPDFPDSRTFFKKFRIRVRRSLHEAYLNTFSLRGENDKNFVVSYEILKVDSSWRQFRKRIKVFFGLEKEIEAVKRRDDSPPPTFGQKFLSILSWIGFVILTFASLFSMAVRTIFQFLPKLMSNISLDFATQCKDKFKASWENLRVGGYRSLVPLVLTSIGMLVAYPLYLAFRMIWVAARAFISPMASLQRSAQSGFILAMDLKKWFKDTIWKGRENSHKIDPVFQMIGKIFQGLFGLGSLALTTVSYIFLFPLVFKYLVFKGITQIANLGNIAQKGVSVLSQGVQYMLNSPVGDFLASCGKFLNTVMPGASLFHALMGVTPEASAIATSIPVLGLGFVTPLKGLLYAPISNGERKNKAETEESEDDTEEDETENHKPNGEQRVEQKYESLSRSIPEITPPVSKESPVSFLRSAITKHYEPKEISPKSDADDTMVWPAELFTASSPTHF